MLYVRFPLSFRNVEDLLDKRGADVSYESVMFGGTSSALNLHARSKNAGQGVCNLVAGNDTSVRDQMI